MPTRTAQETSSYDANVKGSPKNVHDRDPVLIPQLFEDRGPPWHRRRVAIAGAIVLVLVAAALAFLLHRYGVAGAATKVSQLGAKFMFKFTRVVGR